MSRVAFGIAAALLLVGARQEGERIIWTTSKITGSPEPPPPVRAVRAFPALNFKKPVQLVPFPGHARYALVEEDGAIYSFRNDPACDKADLLLNTRKDIPNLDKIDNCRGAEHTFSLAFDPYFAKNRYCYVMYLLVSKNRSKPLPEGSRISRFKVTESDPPRIDPASEEIIITWLAGGHNGCDLQFGNDGFLYISTGDAENPNPPDKLQTGQDVSDLLSAILRIDVHRAESGRRYAIPPDNPFVGVAGARPEIWCYGLRNPWRMSFDRSTGRLWIGDVGWEKWEMVYCGERGSNFGWSVMEGPDPCLPDAKRGPTPIVPPAHAIQHPEAASITGGFVYRGKRLKGFQGQYFCGDWETRRVWALPVHDTRLGDRQTVARTTLRIVAFAEDAEGELFVVDHEGGSLYALVPNDAGSQNAEFPRTISATGLFTSAADQTPAPGVIPYEIHAPRWVDGATGRRWIAFPNREEIQFFDKGRDWPKESIWPRDTVLAKTLSLGTRKLETQILHFDGLFWNGYSYVWNERQTDAALAPAEGAEVELGGGRKWRVPPRAACVSCHNPWPGTALTINGAQLKNVQELQARGYAPKFMPKTTPLVDPYDETAPLDARARSYLAVNCSPCHRNGAGASTRIDLRHDIKLEETRIHGVRPTLGGFDLADPYVVCGGDPARSVLLFRVSKLGQGRMPHIGSEVVDELGVRLLARWIASLPETPCEPAGAAARAMNRKALETGAVDDLLVTTTGALDLLHSLDRLPEEVRRKAIRRALELPPGPIRDLFERFEPPSQRRERLGPSIRPEKILPIKGDAERGKKLVASASLQCAKCHRFGEGPEKLGPDLAKIGAKYNRAQLLESILEPSKTIDPKYVGSMIQTKGGDIVSGIVVSKTESEIVLRDAEKEIRLSASKIERMVPMKNSLMPEGLLQHLTAQEAADLLSYLESLR